MRPASCRTKPISRPEVCRGKKVWLSQHEPRVAEAITSNLRAGDTFWDIGANVGCFTLLAATIVGSRGNICSFEPSPNVFAALRRNVWGVSVVRALRCGIGNRDGEFYFAAQGMSTAASFVEDVTKINQSYWPGTAIRQTRVAMKKVDTLARRFGRTPTLVKIDVEGFELEVLKGATGLLTMFRPTLIIEVHPPQLKLSGGNEALLFQHLEQCGYGWEIIDRSDNSLYWILAENTRSGSNA